MLTNPPRFLTTVENGVSIITPIIVMYNDYIDSPNFELDLQGDVNDEEETTSIKTRATLMSQQIISSVRVPDLLGVAQYTIGYNIDFKQILTENVIAIGFLLTHLYVSANIESVLVSIADFIHKIVSKYPLIIKSVMPQVGSSIDSVVNYVRTFLCIDETDPQLQSPELPGWLKALHGLRDGSSKIFEFPILGKIFNLIGFYCRSSLAICLGFDPYAVFSTPVTVVPIKKTGDAFLCLVDVLLDFITTGYLMYIGKSIDEATHSGTSYSDWIIEVMWLEKHIHLRRMSAKFVSENPNYVHQPEYMIRLKTAITKGKSMLKTVLSHSHNSDKVFIQKNLNSIERILTDVILREQGGLLRPEPFAAYIFGGVGVGKSWLTRYFSQLAFRIANPTIEWDESYVAIIQANDNFFSSMTSESKVIIFDDIGAVRGDNGQPNNDVSSFIKIANSIPFAPEQAAVEDKGRIFCNADYVIGTTNILDLDIPQHFATPAAVYRRFNHRLRISVRIEYEKTKKITGPDGVVSFIRTGELDSFKAMHAPVVNGIQDLWHIAVDEMHISASSENPSLSHAVPEEVLNGNIFEYIEYFTMRMNQHLARQQMMESNNDIKLSVAAICIKCGRWGDHECGSSIVPPLQPIPPQESNNGDLHTNVEIEQCCLDQGISLQGDVFFAWSFQAFITSIVVLFSIFLYQLGFHIKTKVDLKIKEADNLMASLCRIASCSETELQRAHRIGDRLEKILYGDFPRRMRQYSAIAAVVLAGITIYRFTSSLNRQGNIGSTYWEKRIENVPPKPIGRNTTNVTSLGNSCKGSYAKMVFPNNKKLTIVCVRGNDYIANNHSVPRGAVTAEVIFTSRKGISTNKTITFDDSCTVRFPELDIVYMRLSGLNPKKGIHKHLCLNDKYTVGTHYNGYVLHFDHDALDMYTLPSTIELSTAAEPIKGVNTPCRFLHQHQKHGMCGSLVAVHSAGGTFIVGMHYAGGRQGFSNLGRATPITFEHYHKASLLLDSQTLPNSHGSFSPDLFSSSSTFSIDPELHPKATISYIDEGSAKIQGDLVGLPFSDPSCDVKKTIIHDEVVEAFGLSGFTYPNMKKGWTYVNGVKVYNDPISVAAKSSMLSNVQIPPEKMKLATEAFIQDILPLRNLDTLRPLTHHEAINGLPGIPGMSSINFKAGCGIGITGKKKSHCFGEEGSKEWDDEVICHINHLLPKMYRGERVCPMYNATLKSEPVKLYEDGSTKVPRTFCAVSTAWAHMVRKLTLSFCGLVQSNNFAFETGVGVNPFDSNSWSQFYSHLNTWPGRVVAGDYKAYDKTISAQLILHAFQVIIHLCEKSNNYTPEEIRGLWSIAFDTAFPNVVFNGTVVELNGSNPSGHPLTVIINGLIGCILLRVVWLDQGYPLAEFRSNVHLIVYGDDNAINVHPKYDFSHTKIQEGLKRYGFEYTMADKTSGSVPFLSIENCDFLKRKFVLLPSGVVLCPLDKKSVVRMLSFRSGSTLDDLEHLKEVLIAAVAEAFQHGFIFHNYVRTFSLQMLAKFNINTHLMTYEQEANRLGYNVVAGQLIPAELSLS